MRCLVRQLEGPLETIGDEKKSYMSYPSKNKQAITNGICLFIIGGWEDDVLYPKNHESQAHFFFQNGAWKMTIV